LAFYFRILTTMHGQNHFKITLVFNVIFSLNRKVYQWTI